MSESFKLIAGNSFPTVTAHLLDGTTADLSKPHGGAEWQILVVYRGKHCPLCMRYLNLLEAQLPALKELGVSVCAVSADNRAQLTPCYYFLCRVITLKHKRHKRYKQHKST